MKPKIIRPDSSNKPVTKNLLGLNCRTEHTRLGRLNLFRNKVTIEPGSDLTWAEMTLINSCNWFKDERSRAVSITSSVDNLRAIFSSFWVCKSRCSIEFTWSTSSEMIQSFYKKAACDMRNSSKETCLAWSWVRNTANCSSNCVVLASKEPATRRSSPPLECKV